MNRTILLRYLLASLLCAVALTIPFAAFTGRRGEDGRIMGRVIERDSGLVLAAEIGIAIRDGRGITLKHVGASEQGQFEIPGLPAGDVHLTTKLAGYAIEHESISLVEGETRQIEFQLVKAKRVRGVILDPADRPLEDAQVRVIYADETPAHAAVAATYQWETGDAKSDAQGAFAVDAHPEKELIIEASHPSFVAEVSDPMRLAEAEAGATLRLSLSKGVSVEGESRDEKGDLIPGALVRLIDDGERPELRRFISFELLRRRTRQTVSAQDGKFRFELVNPVRKTLIITHPNYYPTRQTLNLDVERKQMPARMMLKRKGAH
jgi:hypothetical protein